MAWFDVYDPATGRWSELEDMPRARDHFQAVVLGDRLYAIGGRDRDLGRKKGANEAFDFTRGEWVTSLAPLPTPRGGFAAAAVGNEILAIGGETKERAHATVEAYDTETDRWRALDPLPIPRHGIQAAVCGGAAYVVAGGREPGGDAPTDVHEVFLPQPGSGCEPASETDAGAVAPGSFRTAVLEGASPRYPTSLQLGPDGRLYVAQQDGLILAYTVARAGEGKYAVTATENRPRGADPEPRRRQELGDRLRHPRRPRASRGGARLMARRRRLAVAAAAGAAALAVAVVAAERLSRSGETVHACTPRPETVRLPEGRASSAGRWLALPSLPHSRDEPRGAAAGGVVYLATGLEPGGRAGSAPPPRCGPTTPPGGSTASFPPSPCVSTTWPPSRTAGRSTSLAAGATAPRAPSSRSTTSGQDAGRTAPTCRPPATTTAPLRWQGSPTWSAVATPETTASTRWRSSTRGRGAGRGGRACRSAQVGSASSPWPERSSPRAEATTTRAG